MSQRRSKPATKVMARGRQSTSGQPAPANRATRSHIRPFGQIGPVGPEGSADMQRAAGSPSYLQWAAFMGGAPTGDGFGAYFADGAGTIQYTWTPSRRG
jgi:hypothetical protein